MFHLLTWTSGGRKGEIASVYVLPASLPVTSPSSFPLVFPPPISSPSKQIIFCRCAANAESSLRAQTCSAPVQNVQSYSFFSPTSVDGCRSMVFILCTVLYIGFYDQGSSSWQNWEPWPFSVTNLWWMPWRQTPPPPLLVILDDKKCFEMKIRSLWIWKCESEVSTTE